MNYKILYGNEVTSYKRSFYIILNLIKFLIRLDVFLTTVKKIPSRKEAIIEFI